MNVWMATQRAGALWHTCQGQGERWRTQMHPFMDPSCTKIFVHIGRTYADDSERYHAAGASTFLPSASAFCTQLTAGHNPLVSSLLMVGLAIFFVTPAQVYKHIMGTGLPHTGGIALFDEWHCRHRFCFNMTHI